MKRIYQIVASFLCAGFISTVMAAPASLAPYTDNPLVEFLAHQRYHTFAGVQIDTASNDHDAMTLIGGVGYFPTDKISLGLYASTRGSDRRFPVRMSSMTGFGVFSDYNLAPQAVLQPFAGLRVGMLDTTGPASPTSLHIAALGGLKWAINSNIRLTAAGVLNWAQEDLLDYTESDDGSYSTSNTDLGIELSLRFGF
jgi:hypothetical protein